MPPRWSRVQQGIRRSGPVPRLVAYLRIVFRHVLPNCLAPLIVIGHRSDGISAIALESTLSFLGVGLPGRPSRPLGVLISNGFEYMMSGRYWISGLPPVWRSCF